MLPSPNSSSADGGSALIPLSVEYADSVAAHESMSESTSMASACAFWFSKTGAATNGSDEPFAAVNR